MRDRRLGHGVRRAGPPRAARAADRLVQQTADLGDVPCTGRPRRGRRHERCADVLRNRCLELGGGGGERLDLAARALECRLDRSRLGPPGSRVRDALLRPLQSQGVHGREATLRAGWTPRASSTTSRPSSSRRPRSSRVTHRGSSCIAASRMRSSTGRSASSPSSWRASWSSSTTRASPARLRLRRESAGGVEVLPSSASTERTLGGARAAVAAAASRRGAGAGAAPRVARRGALARRAPRRAGGRDAASSVHPRAARRPRPLPDGVRRRGGVSSGTDGWPASHRDLLEALDPVRVTLHVGLDTFRPVTASTLEEHELHGERYSVEPAAWERIAAAERVLAVGTTTVRVFETLARTGELAGRTTLFITPGFEFRRVNALLTNFHLPRSTPRWRWSWRSRGRRGRPAPLPRGDRGATASTSFGDAGHARSCDGSHHSSLSLPSSSRGVGFLFRIDATDGSARAGVLTTSHGEIRTPAFMPVGTKGTVKSLHPDEVRALGADVVLANTYHLHFRPARVSSRNSAASTRSPAGAARS